jgi:quercetin dioxygenase-like cupin family protein
MGKINSTLDAVKLAPDSYKVVLENDRVRVLEYRIKPGMKNAMHSHPDFLLYTLTPEKFKLTFPDGKTIDSEAKAGEMLFYEAETHSYENLGSTEAHGYLIELK